MSTTQHLPRDATRQVCVANSGCAGVAIGGGAPVSVQTMLATPTGNVELALAQINKVAALGCEIVRVAVPTKASLEPFKQICEQSPLPVVADIHFDYRLAIGAAKAGAAKLRINPGNIGGGATTATAANAGGASQTTSAAQSKVDAVINAAAEANIPIRIGVNAGSLDQKYRDMQGMTLPQKLAASVQEYVEHFELRGFKDVVVSAKAHDVPTTIEAYRELSRTLPTVPLHIGITEAGTLMQGTVKSAVGLGILLSEGIGNTMRVSLTSGIEDEVKVAWQILSALGVRRRSPEIVSCPTCGRTQIDLISIANTVSDRLAEMNKPIKVAVMGCVVNGPGEAADADIGVAAGKGMGVVFKHGEPVRKVDEAHIVEALFEEIERL